MPASPPLISTDTSASVSNRMRVLTLTAGIASGGRLASDAGLPGSANTPRAVLSVAGVRCRKGISDARPSLLVDGAASTTKEKPLHFLGSMPAGQGEAALFHVMMLMTAAMNCCRPERSPATTRWFLALVLFSKNQRAQGAGWELLSDFWRGLMQKVDMSVDAFMLHRAADVAHLDTTWVTNSTMSYHAAYLTARAPEITQRAVQCR